MAKIRSTEGEPRYGKTRVEILDLGIIRIRPLPRLSIDFIVGCETASERDKRKRKGREAAVNQGGREKGRK